MPYKVVAKITGEIDDWSQMALGWYISDALYMKQNTLPIIITSPGGSIYSALSMVDMLKESGLKIVTIALGKAFSAGALLLACGDERYATENATVMIHQAWNITGGKVSEMESSVFETRRLNDKVFSLMEEKTGNESGYFQRLTSANNNADLYMDSNEALKHNLIQNIGFPKPSEIFKEDPESDILKTNSNDENMCVFMSLANKSSENKKYDRFPVKRKNRKIFATGKFKGESYTNEDLKRMYDNYQALKNTFTPAIFETHDRRYKVGEYEQVYLKKDINGNNEIFADYSLLERVAEKQDTGELDAVSIEFLPRMESRDGKVYKDVITGLALEGANPVALWSVPGIVQNSSLTNELNDYKFDENKLVLFSLKENEEMSTVGNVDLDGADRGKPSNNKQTFTEAELNERLENQKKAFKDEMKQMVSDMRADVERDIRNKYESDLSELQDKNAKLEAKYEADKIKAEAKEDQAWLRDMQGAEKNILNPVTANKVQNFMDTFLNEPENKLKKFSLTSESEGVEMSAKQAFKSLLESFPKQLACNNQLPDHNDPKFELTKRDRELLEAYKTEPKQYQKIIENAKRRSEMKAKGLDPNKPEDIVKFRKMS